MGQPDTEDTERKKDEVTNQMDREQDMQENR